MTEVGETGDFDKKKQKYFSRLGLSVRESFDLHKKAGLWDRVPESSKRDWGNVSEHCLVEVARVGVFSKLLGLSDKVSGELAEAAAMHDFYKKGEIETARAAGFTWESFNEASDKATKMMRENGVGGSVVRLVNSIGHYSLNEVQEVLNKPELGDADLAYLVMHYVDDYTINADWAVGGDIIGERMKNNANNPRYAQINETGRQHFNGETAYEAQARVGHAVQDRLAHEISNRAGINVEPMELPIYVDNRIREQINETGI